MERTLEFRKEVRVGGKTWEVSSSIAGTQIMWMNETSDGMSMDIRESEDWALGSPPSLDREDKKEPVKGASEGISGDIGQYEVLESKPREYLNGTENCKLSWTTRNEGLRKIMYSDLEFNFY